jgi:predicted acyltransferase
VSHEPSTPAPHRRLESIDQFRGFAILLMVLANYLAGVSWIPAWLKHAPDVGLTVIDLIAPFFIFAIGLTFGLSVRRRVSHEGWARTAWHTAGRYLGLLGVGALLSAGEIALGQSQSGTAWGVLQAIGVAGLVTLLLIRLPTWPRAAAGLALLGVYQVLLDNGWLATVLASQHGGLQGALDWAAMLILSTVLADLFHNKKLGSKWFIAGCVLALLVGLVLAAWLPVSKNRVSATYVLVSLGASGLVFGGFVLLADRLGRRLPLLTAWGRNPFVLYVLHLVLLGIVVLPGIPSWYTEAPAWLVALQALGLVFALSSIAAWLQKRKLVLSF